MLSRILAPVYTLNLESLRAAGRFASPEGEEGGGKEGEGKPDGAGKEGEGGDKPKPKPEDTVGRISTLVEERNTAQQERDRLKSEAERLQRELDQLKANDQTQVIKDLQKQLTESQSATKTRFDKLLETELANLPEAAQKAVKAIPGGSEAQFDWLVANRALLQPAGGEKPEEKPAGASNEKKPKPGEKAGASSVAKSYVESRKPKTAGFPGLTG